MSQQKGFSSIFKPKTQRLALEPRIVFDAALPIAIAEQVDNTTNTEPSTTAAAHQDAESLSDFSPEIFAESPQTRQLVFIDAGIENQQSIANQFANSEVILLNGEEDGLLQIAAAVAGRNDIDAIHLFSHGSDGELQLGNSAVNEAALRQDSQDYSAALSQIRAALSGDADILLYGCDVASSAEGQSFVAALAAATGADIAASTDPTGAKGLGGDWDLEWQAGNIETQAVEVTGFASLLGPPQITDTQAGLDTRSTDEDTPLSITGVSVTDDDVGVELEAAISVTGGSITLAGAGWSVTAGADGSSAVTITGTEAEINTALNGMIFTPTANSNSLDPAYTPLIDITVNDVDTPDGPTTIQISDIEVVAINDAPTISGGTPLEIDEGGSSSFSAVTTTSFGFTQAQLGLTDIDTQAVQTIIKIAAVPTNGDLLFNGNLIAVGSTFSAADIANFSYQHDGSQVTAATTDSFLITVDDGAGGLITNQSISVNINPINQAPTLEGVITVIEGETAVNLADNGLLIAPFNSPRGAITFFDPEGGAAQSYEITSLPVNGTLFYNGVAITAATVGTPFAVADPSLLTYSHSGGENTSDSFNMQVVDDGGGEGNVLSDAATIQLDIVPNNDDPLLNTNVPQTMAPGSSSITLTAAMLEVTDVDSANTSLTYTLTSVPNPADGYFTVNGQTLTAGATFTQADINAGNVSYVTLSDTPRTDSMTFTVKDGGIRLFPDSRDGGIYDNPTQGSPLTPITFDVIVPDTVIVSPDPVPSAAPINTSPVSGGSNTIDAADLNEGGTFNFSDTELLITDAESSADELVYRLVSLPTSGFISLNGASLTYNQTFTQADVNNGNVSFVHNGDEDFVDSFNYTLSDGNTESAPQSFSIAVTPQNDTPEAVNNNAVFVSENNVVVITDANIILSDRDNSASDNEGGVHAANDELSFRITADTLHGELRLDGVLITANTTVVTLAQLQNGDLTYTHSGGENFSDSFSIVPLDDSGVVVPTATNASSEGSTLVVPITIFPVNDAPSFVSKWQLVTGEAGAVAEGGTRVIGGAESYATINGISGSGLPTPDSDTAVAHLVFGDDDNSSIQRQYRITDAPNNGRLFLGGKALGAGSVFTQDALDSGLISYEHDGSETNSDSFDYVVSDGDWTANDSQSFAQGTPALGSTFLIEITPTNDVIEISGPDNLDVFAAGAATTNVPVITLADLDFDDGITAGETDFMRIEVSCLGSGAHILNYTAPDPSSLVAGKGTNNMILQGTKAEIDAVLASLTIAFSADQNSDSIQLRVIGDDRLRDGSGVLLAGANGGAINDDGSAVNSSNNRVAFDIALRVSNNNDAPTITNVSSFTVNEDAQITLGGFALSDADSFGEDVTATVELFNDAGRTTLASSTNEGRLRLSSQPGIVIAGNNSNTLTITGNITDVENALNALRFQGRGDFNGPGLGNGTLYLTTTIADFDHADGQQTATVDNEITITPVNDAPVLAINATLASGLTLNSGTSISINAEGGSFTLNDNSDTSEGAADLISVSVAATNNAGGAPYGTLTATASGAAVITNDNTDTITITGTSADVEATLNSLVYAPANANVDTVVRITTTADDRDGGIGNGTEGVGVDGNNTDAEDFLIAVSGTNDAPVITVPVNPTVLEDSSANAISGISIDDPDDFGSDLQVSLTLGGTPKGTINLSTIAGLTFTTGDGTNDTAMVFTGTKAAINTALASLTFTPTGDQNTVAFTQALTIAVDDQGNTGTGGALTDSETLQITITPVNDAPLRTAASTSLPTLPEDTANPAGDTVSNLFGPRFDDSTDTVTNGSTANTLAGVAIVDNAATATQGAWQYNSGGGWLAIPTTASLSDPFLLSSTDQVRFLAQPDWNGTPGDLTVRLIDSSSGAVATGAGADLSGAATGGTTAFSNAANAVTLGTVITAVNDAPVASGSSTLAAIDEDNTNPSGAALSSVITSSQYDDSTDTIAGGSTATALGGIAIIGNAANPVTEGSWQYNSGAGWVTITNVGLSSGNALVLPATADIRFLPVAEYSGTPGALTVHLADSVQAEASGQDISGNLGTTETWSAASINIATAVNPVNDAPVISGVVTTHTYTENDPAVVLEPALSLADVDDADLNQAVITIFSGFVAGDTLALDAALAASLGLTVDSSVAGTLTISGNATKAEYQSLLQTVSYSSSSDNPGSADRIINWTVRDENSEVATNGQQTSAVVTTTVEVTPVNDAPVITVPANSTVLEDSTANAIGVSIADADDSGSDLQVSLTLGGTPKGTINLSTIAGLTFTTGDGANDTAMVFTGTKAAINTALASLTFTPTGDQNTVAFTQALTIAVDDQGNTGTGGALTDSETLQITITPVNDAPLRTAASTSLPTLPEDTTNPAGDTVSNLFGPRFDDSTDTVTNGSTANTLAGVAIVDNAASAAQGAWQYNSGGVWLAIPTTASLANPFLLSSTDQVRFLALPDWNGTPGDLTVRLIDSSSGAVTTGAGADLSAAATGGTTAFSNAANAVTLGTVITPVNDAPLRTAPSASLPTLLEDTVNPAGDTVSNLFGPRFDDSTDTVTNGSTANTLAGVAIVDNAATATQGAWQYNSGGGWLVIPTTASLVNPFLLSSTDQVRFLAQPDWNGTPGDLTVRLIDSSSGAVTTGAGADLSAAATGGTTAFSNAANAVTLGTVIAAVNDAPVASGSATLTAIDEDNTNPAGAALSSVITSSQYDDSTDTVVGGSSATALGGIAIIGNAANPVTEGSWQYDSGAGWVTITNVGLSSGNALVLPATADIRFLPVAEYSGTPGELTVHLADSVQAEASGQDISANLGTTETWSAANINIATVVNPVNDAPVISGVATTHSYTENDPAVVLEPALSLADIDDADLNQAVITIAGGFTAGDTLALDAALVTSLGLTVDSSVAGTLTISGNATKAEYQSLLQTVSYSSGANPGNADRIINWTVRDENVEAAANGQQTSAVVTTTVEVVPVNNAATVSSADVSLDETDAPLIFSGTLTSIDPDDPDNTFTPVTITRPNGELILNVNGTWTFTASSAFDSLNVGDSINEVFNVTTVDGTPTTIEVTINGTNDNPVAAGDTQTTDEDTLLNATVPAGSDVDGTIDPNGFALVTNVGEGSLTFNPDGSYSFDPAGDFDDLAPGGSRDVSFTYTNSDNNGGVSTPVTVTITVTGLNDIAVSTLPEPQTATEDTTLTINGIGVQDAENAILTTTLSLPANAGVINVIVGGGATITDNGTNTVVITGTSTQINAALLAVDYTPADDFNTSASGPIAMGIEITEGFATHVSSLALTVLPVIDISDDAVTTNETQQVTFDVLANDNFEGVATVSVFTQAQNGIVVLNQNGTFSYTPNVDFEGTDSFTYTASVNGITETATVNITVLPVNDNPVANDDSYSVDGATGTTGVVLNLLDNDTDINDDTLVVTSIAGQPVIAGQAQTLPVPNGEVTISASGVITFYPDPSFVGGFNFDYEISDGEGGTASATIYIDITAESRVEGEHRHSGTFRPDFTVPLRPVDPALHVLLSVQEARNEIQLSSGLNLLDIDSVAYKELLGGLDIGLAFASGDKGLGELGGKDFSPLGIERYPDNALYVQQSVRQIPLPTSHAVFVQLAVNQSQLESAARNGLVDSFNSASLGVNHLLDPFAKPELSATKIVANNDRWQADDDVNNAQEKLADDDAPSSLMADHKGFFDDIDDGGESITAASSFSEQLKQSAALRLASGSENIITHHKKA